MCDKNLDEKTKNYLKKINKIIVEHKLKKNAHKPESASRRNRKHDWTRNAKPNKERKISSDSFSFKQNSANLSPSKSEQEEIEVNVEESLKIPVQSTTQQATVSLEKMDFNKFLNNYIIPKKRPSDEPSNIFDEFGINIQNNDTFYEAQSPKKLNENAASISFTINTNNFNTSDNVDEEGEVKNAKFYNISAEKKLVVLTENTQLSFHGIMSIRVIHGRLEILGYEICNDNKEYKLYSPRGSSLLYIKNVTELLTGKQSLCTLDAELNNLKSVFVKKSSAVFICTKLVDVGLAFIEKHIPQQILPKTALQFLFEPKGDWNVIEPSPDWDKIAANISNTTKLFICGGKGVGKSTFLRYTINKVLMGHEKVLVIDLDPGQAEFTVPGCISVVTVTEPLLGVNFTHLKQADKSVISSINVGNSPALYICSIQHLMHYVNRLKERCPILINYMGFTQGIGLNIISSAISIVQPTEVVQIQSSKKKKNFLVPLKKHVVRENNKLFTKYLENCFLDYKLIETESKSDEKEGWVLEPRQMREMCTLSYFGQFMNKTNLSVLSTALPLYETKLNSIKFVDIYGGPLDAAATNASLVALCSILENSLFECFGWGIVRGIDIEKNITVIISPVSETVMERTTHLVVGNVFLPPSVYMTPDNVIGLVPYVQLGEMDSLGKVTKRSYIPVNKK